MQTTYTDSTGSISTQITNTFQENGASLLLLNLDGVEFEGRTFDDFELVNPTAYTAEQIKRFTFSALGDLCNCTLDVAIPTKVINKKDQTEIATTISMSLQLGKPASNNGIDFEQATFSIELDGNTFEGVGDYAEIGLDNLKKAIGDYHFKNCYGCQYADYSPYGQSFFGDLMCFKQQKQAYLSLNNNFSKQAFFEVIDQGFIQVQETYCCSEFEQRLPNTGYRG